LRISNCYSGANRQNAEVVYPKNPG